MEAEWCIVGTLMPYPYQPDGPYAEFRSQKIFPAGAKLHVVGGYAGMGYDAVTVVGYAHRRRSPVCATIRSSYVGGWRARLIYRPVILAALHRAHEDNPWDNHRWLEGREPGDPAYGDHLARVAAWFQTEISPG